MVLLGRFSLLAFPHLLGICLSSLRSPPFPLLVSALIPFSLAEVQLSLTLTLSHHTIWCFGQSALFLFCLAKTALAYLLTAVFVALRPLSPFQQAQYTQVFPLKPAPIVHALCWHRQHQQVCHFFSLLSDSRCLVLSSIFPFTSMPLVETVYSFLLFYEATMDPQTLVSLEKRRG